MTPTLIGRWQSRLLLLGTVGTLTTLIFVLWLNTAVPLLLLAAVICLGLGWDVLYDQLQQQRWDHDWPPIFQLLAGVWEGGFLFGLTAMIQFAYPSLPLPSPAQHWLHYTTVWLLTFTASQSIMRLVFPRWRFQGGEWI